MRTTNPARKRKPDLDGSDDSGIELLKERLVIFSAHFWFVIAAQSRPTFERSFLRVQLNGCRPDPYGVKQEEGK